MRLPSTLTIGLLAAGCTQSPQQVAPADAISIDQAFKGVAAGLRSFSDELGRDPKLQLGLVACRLIVNFNISATANRSNDIQASVAAPTEIAQLSVGGTLTNSATGSRGNTVTIELDSRNVDICPYYLKGDSTMSKDDTTPKKDDSNTGTKTKTSQQHSALDTGTKPAAGAKPAGQFPDKPGQVASGDKVFDVPSNTGTI